jgi:nucleoside-triphosphatase THEP1
MSDPTTPELYLAEDLLQYCQHPQLFIITGESGAGKTSACRLLIQQARLRGCPAVGLISPPVYQSGIKVAIDLTEIASGETRRLACKRERDPAGRSTLGWKFDPATVNWGNQVLDGLPVSPLLIVDEIGPLEFQKQAGFHAALRLLDEQRHLSAYIVIRTACLANALERWPWAQIIRDFGHVSPAGQL